MAFTHGSTAVVKLNDGSTLQDLSPAGATCTLDLSKDTAETTSFGDTAKAYIPGLQDATFSIDGNRDATIEGYVFGSFTAAGAVALEYYPEGEGTGKKYYTANVIVTSFSPSSDVGDANKWSIECQVTGGVSRATDS